METRKLLGEIMLEFGFVTERQLNEALQRQQREHAGRKIGEVMIELGFATDAEVTRALARQFNLEMVFIDDLKINQAVIDKVPGELAKTHNIMPVDYSSGVLTVAMGDPLDLDSLDKISFVVNAQVECVLARPGGIRDAIANYYGLAEQELIERMKADTAAGVEITTRGMDDLEMMEGDDDDAPIIRYVTSMITEAMRSRASDIHVEPMPDRVRVRYRVDGICFEARTIPKRLQGPIISRIKIMSGMDIAEKRKPQDGKFRLRYEGREIDFRVSVLPVVHGEKVVLRILDSSSLKLNLNDLGFEEKALNDFRRAITAPYGMVLVTGPTGSGKSTTLYSAIKEVLTVEKNIVTVEDPVEYQIEGVNQVPVNPKRGLTFAAALRSILRQDPDIVMIGEIRDLETAEIAVKAALTGHLVLSTLHTNDAASTITRLVDMGIDPFMVASSVLLCSAQRLGRRLCNYCKQPVEIPKERLISLGLMEEDIERFGMNLYGPKGCSRCTNGYKGRFALLETLPMTERIQRIVVSGGSALEIKKAALEEGMLTLRRVGLINALKGVTSVENVLSITLGD